MAILFVNACVRENSRTLAIARDFLNKCTGEIIELNLEETNIQPLNRETLRKRAKLLGDGDLNEPMLKYAVQFANADEIVIAAPFWDLSFPALLKVYIEAITASGITFRYDEDEPVGLCKASKLTYITTAGGPIFADFGYAYIKTLAQSFYGINDVECIRAENLDVDCISSEEVLTKCKITKIK